MINNNFKVGDKIICIDNSFIDITGIQKGKMPELEFGKIYVVKELMDSNIYAIRIFDIVKRSRPNKYWYSSSRFRKATKYLVKRFLKEIENDGY